MSSGCLQDVFRMSSGCLQDDAESFKQAFREHSEHSDSICREKESNKTSSYCWSLKYFVLLRAKWLGKVVHTIEKVFPSFPTSVRKTPLSSLTPAPDFMERGYLYRENYIFRARCLAIS